MINSDNSVRVYLVAGNTDMRKSIDTLALIVQDVLKLDPLTGHLFVFCNRQKNRLKVLYWDGNGFWLCYKRLEQGRFAWPVINQTLPTLQVSRRELNWLLEGLPLNQPKALAPLALQSVA